MPGQCFSATEDQAHPSFHGQERDSINRYSVLQLFDDIPLRVAAGLSCVPQQQCDLETASDTLSDVSDNDEDPDFDPLNGEDPEVDDSNDEQEEGFRMKTDVSPKEERQFLVSETQ